MAGITRLGITIGDPTGIGPEIVAAVVAGLPREWLARITVYGDRGPLERGARAIGVALPADLGVVGDGVGDAAQPGKPDERSGAAQVGYLEAAIAAARRGELSAIATAPISKTWAKRAGFQFPGHTELLAARLGVDHVVMLFAGPKLKVALATIHVPLAEVARTLTTRSLVRTIELVARSLIDDFGITAPRIGVVGLNPHAGEGGLLGTEDEAIIRPALDPPSVPETEGAPGDRRATGARLAGPLVPDVAFRELLAGQHDAVVAMYHDQGLIPVKLIDFDEAVNVTLGLPIVRTSPDHGTAYDIAGTGTARSVSMRRAVSLAFEIVARRARLGADRGPT